MGTLVHNPAELKALEADLPFYALTRPRAVVRPGDLPEPWAVGPDDQGYVRWLFQGRSALNTFARLHGDKVLVFGYLGPLETESRVWR